MKKNLFFSCICMLACLCLVVTSCDKESTETIYAPTLTVSTNVVSISSIGGAASFSYSVENPADDGSVSCRANVNWISDLECSSSGIVGFSVAENVAEEIRQTDITVTYSSSYGEKNCVVTVVQYGADAPVFTVQPTAVVAEAEGGQYSFGYTVENPADDGSVSCKVEEDWVSDFDYSTDGTIGFTVTENPAGEGRSVDITVTYSSSSYGEMNCVVTVVQYGADAPVFTVQPTAVVAEAEGGQYSFGYTVENPADDGSVSCKVEEDWVSDFDYSTDGTIGFTVGGNDGEELRSTVITVTYSFGDGNELSQEVTVVQDHTSATGDENWLSGVIGTYTAYGRIDGDGYKNEMASWTVKIFEYTGDDGDYDLYIDGIIPYAAGYDTDGTFTKALVATYTDGKILVPTQCLGNFMSDTYYIGYMPCTKYDDDDEKFRFSSDYPDCTITGDEGTGEWTCDYGMMAYKCLQTSLSARSGSYLQSSAPGVTLTRTSKSTDD
ncbi:MAG: hypothetical protein LUD72_01190 [Bacteroidales bacterium]|nr:hypothetical protein [Bacteroidales bacterium]